MKVYIDDAPEPTPAVAPKENLCTKLEDAICSRMRGAFGPQRGPGFMRNAIQTIVREELSTCKGNSTSSVVHLGYTCDGCGMAPITGIRYRCITCVDYNFCEACESSAVHPHPFVKLTSSEPEDKCAMYAGTFSSNSPIAAEWASGILRKKYIDHSKPRIEILGTTKLAKNLTPGSDYVKVWKIQNVGRISIPKGTSLLTVKGFSKHTVQPLEMDLKPGDMTDITLNFESAGSKGRYVNIFKLHTPTGDKIGARFRVKYKVD